MENMDAFQLIAIITGAVITTMILTAGAMWWILSTRAADLDRLRAKAEEAQAEVRALTDKLAEFRTFVAERYATKDGIAVHLDSMQRAIDRLSDKFDHLIEKVFKDRLAGG